MNNSLKKNLHPINPKLARTSRLVLATALGCILAFHAKGSLTISDASGYLIILVIVAAIQFYMAVNRMTELAIQEKYITTNAKSWDVIKRFNKDVHGLNEHEGIVYRSKHEPIMKCIDQVIHFALCGVFVLVIWLIYASINFFA